MAIPYIIVDEKDFSFGIDSRSAENQIEKGYLKDLLNGDILERRILKRKGYQGHAGNLPVRVTSVESTNATNQICFTLDTSADLSSAVNLLSVRSTPLVVYGRLSGTKNMGSGTFNATTDTGAYYSGFVTTVRKTLTATASAPPFETITVENDEHRLGTANLFVGITESLSPTDNSNSLIGVEQITVDESTYDLTLDYQNGTGTDKQAFVYYLDKDAVSGSVYLATGTGSSASIPAGTHSLGNFNIIVRCWEDLGTTRRLVSPDSVTISSTGQVDVTFSSSINYVIILSATDAEKVLSGSIASGSTGTIVLDDAEGPFLFEGVYLQNGSTLEMVRVDAIEHDPVAGTTTFTITNNSSSADSFRIFYEYGQVRSTQLCVTDANVTSDVTDDTPQLTIWGLDHSEIYGSNKTGRSGWVNHIDSYRREGENRLASGLGGNLFTSRERSEVAASYHLPELLPSLAYTVSGTQVIGPLFWDTGDTPARTRGYITSDSSGTGWATVTAVSYDTGNGWTKYTLSLPNKAILDSSGSPTSLSSVISTTTSREDWLTVDDMSYARHNGTFRIRQVTDGTNEIFVWVENDTNNEDYDDSGLGGQAAVFTDELLFSTNTTYLPADLLQSSLFQSASLICEVLSTSGARAVIGGLVDRVEVGNGLQLPAQRTSSVVPLRSTTDVVRGDMLSYSEVDRLLRVKYINTLSDTAVTINGDGEEATVILSSGNTDGLTSGMQVTLVRAGDYSGTVTIADITGGDSFTFASTLTDTGVSGSLVGNTIHIDEDLEFQDSVNDSSVFEVVRRWIPAEAPDDSYNLTPSTTVRHWDVNPYSDQPFLRSVMVQNNMYFTNGSDEVLKYDGDNVYRAGLFPWQPGVFLQKDTTPTAKIVTGLRSIAYSAIVAAEGRLTITAATTGTIPVGSSVRLSGSTTTYTIREYQNDGSTYYVLVNSALDASVSASGTVSEVGQFRYYYRLNAVDVNGNIVASAVAQSQDYVMELTADAAIRHRLVGMPAWHIYDYDRLEVEIYRTKMGTTAPYYRATTLQMTFNAAGGYLDFTDSFADSDLIDLDAVNTALVGAELGTRWNEPLRANYLTSIGNRLVLANIRDYPQLDIQIVADGSVTVSTFTGDKMTFRRDNTSTATLTDMISTAVYEWVDNSGAVTVTGITGTVGASFSVAAAGHGFTTPGQWVYLYYNATNDADSSNRPLTYAGWWQIASVTDANNFVINFSGSEAGAATAFPERLVFATARADIPVLLGTDGNLGMLNGNTTLVLFQTMRRMALAINATMRKVDTTISGMSTFVPWLTARGGNDLTPAGRLIVRQPRSDDSTMELKLGTFTGYNLFVNDTRRASSDEISATTRVFPSRILLSYENYPEIFDAPTVVLDSESDSAVDINSADGQEITGVIPFFGEAAFGAAQQSGILVVFKTNSIYLVDINEKVSGRNAVQRIETEGLGCTAPYSIAVTKSGIMFANESGVYCLRRNQNIQYIGRFLERNWLERVDRSELDLVQGHHYGVGRQYKISVPLLDSTATENSEVFVYDHTAEQEGRIGAWSRYDNHPATGWANLQQDAFFGSTAGRVFSIRRLGDLTDFRDDSAAVTFDATLRANDFGNSGIRKVVDKVIVHYRTGVRNTGTALSTATDLSQEFRETTAFVIPVPSDDTGLDDVPPQDVVTISHATDRRRGTYFQARLTNSTIDESLEVAGVDYLVGGLQEKGTLQAKRTQSK